MRLDIAAALLGIATTACAQIDTQCPGQGLCYSLNIPESTASKGDGDIFFQITASTQFSWVAMGQGQGMTGAQIFVLYTDPSGKNVTLSPRLGVGHVMPEFNPSAQVTLLEGSGVVNGRMTANVRCSSCNQWKGGSADFSSNSASFVFAGLPGNPLNDGETAVISQHTVEGDLNFDLANAKGGQDVNPFYTSGSGGQSPPGSTGGSGNSGSTYGGSGDGADLLAAPNAYERNPDLWINAHGIVASIAIVILLPIGAIIIRVLSFRQVVWLHAAVQIIGTLAFIAAFGLGVYVADNEDEIDEYHPVIGIILLVLILIQPILGVIHHRMYKQHGRRTLWSHAHVWLGRIIITLGIINGGLGLMLAEEESKTIKYTYAIVGGVIWLLYVAAAIFGEVRKSKATSAQRYPKG
jgi:uncharacterized membrane protein